ncbi:MAG: hypothetical protein ACXWQR_14120 [Ktedonobacterales bacterium]
MRAPIDRLGVELDTDTDSPGTQGEADCGAELSVRFLWDVSAGHIELVSRADGVRESIVKVMPGEPARSPAGVA